jgi:hypothetical protein
LEKIASVEMGYSIDRISYKGSVPSTGMKRNLLREAIEKPEKHPLTFIFVITLALGVAVNGLSDLVFNLLGDQITQLIGISKSVWQGSIVFILVASVILGISNIWSRIRKLFQRNRTVDEVRAYHQLSQMTEAAR